MAETLRNRDDDNIEVLNEVRRWIDLSVKSHPYPPVDTRTTSALLRLVEDHIYACHELLSFARNHANYQESQQWRDWAHRLDTILPEIGRYDW